jgi:hypothetical protein
VPLRGGWGLGRKSTVGKALAATFRQSLVIVSLHIATGAAAGAVVGSPLRALLLGPVLHLAADRVPHQDIASRRFEIWSGVAALMLLAARRGPLDPATLGAIASSAPDLEHVVPSLRLRGRKLFHGSRGWHRSGAFPATIQLLLAGTILGVLAATHGRSRHVLQQLEPLP